MNVTIKLFASARRYIPENGDGNSCSLEMKSGASVEDLVARIGIPPTMPKMVLVNGLHSNNSRKLSEGDVVSIIPPIAGG
jgi:molybdopterin converting factor small subunit